MAIQLNQSVGIQRKLKSKLKELYYADDICAVTHRFEDMNAFLTSTDHEDMADQLKMNPLNTNLHA